MHEDGGPPAATPGDVRLWILALDDALAPRLPKGQRRFALKEMRNLVEDLSFRNAFLDDRFAPDDRDLGRALAALKPPARVAEVLARRAPVYRRKRRASLARTFLTLALILGAGFGLSQLAAGDESVPLAAVTYANTTAETSAVRFEPVVVPEGLSRLDVTIHATNLDKGGFVVVRMLSPTNEIAYERTFSREARAYDHANLPPTPGTWHVAIDYVETKGATRVDVTGVRAATS